MPFNLAGGVTGSKAEVETASLAARFTPRPIDVTTLGSYRVGIASGVEAAGLGAASPIFAFRAGTLTTVRRLTFEFGSLGTGFAVGSALFNLFIARNWVVNDTGGTALTMSTANTNKMKTGHAYSAVLDIRGGTTGVLTAGTRTKDTNAIACVNIPILATTSFIFVPQRELISSRPGDWPITLAANEGLVLEATVPATGTWTWAVNIDWDEVAAFN